jgi:hypothetical protein
MGLDGCRFLSVDLAWQQALIHRLHRNREKLVSFVATSGRKGLCVRATTEPLSAEPKRYCPGKFGHRSRTKERVSCVGIENHTP